MSTTSGDSLTSAVAGAVQRSSTLRKELGLFDLMLAQMLVIIVPDYLATSVKAGSAQAVFWIAGILLFFLPLALLVVHMNRLLPVEGGLYEWARIAFNDQLGFMVAWNLWLYGILYVGVAGFITVSFASYVIPGAAWIASSKVVLLAASAAMVGATMLVAALGLNLGKWINNLATMAFLVTIAFLIVSPFVHLWRGTLAEYHPLALAMPSLTVFSVSVFSKMTFGALTGFEFVAALAGECRNPRRDLPRSVLFTAPIIALIYILATAAIQAFVPLSAEDVVAPVPQALSRAAHGFPFAGTLVSIAIGVLFLYYLATFCIFFGVCTRLPMVAGWDHLVPPWFSRLHPRYRTPVNSILFLGIAALLVGLGASVGVSPQEAFQLLLTCSFTFYAIAYVALFAIPLFSPKQRGLRPGLWLRLAAGSGLLTTLLFIVLSLVPIIDLQDASRYSMKIIGVIAGANLIAVMVYRAGKQKRVAEAPSR